MNFRSCSFPLLVSTLLALAACGAPQPRPGSQPREAPSGPAEIVEGRTGLPSELETLPYGSLEEVAAATRRITTYQPGQVMAVLRTLGSMPSDQLSAAIETQAFDAEFTEWLELSLQLRRVLVNGATAPRAARHWERYHYGHVVTAGDFTDLVARLASQYTAPLNVAVLLPETGGLSMAGDAIRDGIISAFLERPGESTLRFYASGTDSAAALQAYQQALKDGATQVIGPLRAESAQALAGLADHAVPVLLLNDPEASPSTQRVDRMRVNGLSLSQTEEARIAAAQLLGQGLNRALVVAPDNPWGQRIEAAFMDEFVASDGRIVANAHFDPASSDHSDVLTGLLQIDESIRRKQALQSRLGIPLEFEPIRRDDFDFIYLVAEPVQARQLRPLFKFHNAGDVPVYAVGRIYSGRHELTSDQDLDGAVFPITPWQLDLGDTPLPDFESLRGGAYSRLYALGRDAWSLLRWLPLLQRDPGLVYRGNVGSLQMRSDGYLERRPAWAQFSGGQPTPYAWPIRP